MLSCENTTSENTIPIRQPNSTGASQFAVDGARPLISSKTSPGAANRFNKRPDNESAWGGPSPGRGGGISIGKQSQVNLIKDRINPVKTTAQSQAAAGPARSPATEEV